MSERVKSKGAGAGLVRIPVRPPETPATAWIPGGTWTLSQETRDAIEEIERHSRRSRLAASRVRLD